MLYEAAMLAYLRYGVMVWFVPVWRTERRSSCTWLRSGRPADTAEGRRWSPPLTAGLPVKLRLQHEVNQTERHRWTNTHNIMHTRGNGAIYNAGNACRLMSSMLHFPAAASELYSCHSASSPTWKHWTTSRSALWKKLRLMMPHFDALCVCVCVCWWAATSSLPSDVKPVLSDHPSERPIRPRLDCGKRNFRKELS